VVLSSTKAVIAYKVDDVSGSRILITYVDDDFGENGTAIAENISGNSASFGTAVTFESNAVSYTKVTVISSTQAGIAYYLCRC
jgi:hypothetical protein